MKDNENIKEYSSEEMLKKGTKPNLDNFRNFVFDKNDIVIFFNQYDVAPYVAGSFIVRVPYSKIEKKTPSQ